LEPSLGGRWAGSARETDIAQKFDGGGDSVVEMRLTWLALAAACGGSPAGDGDDVPGDGPATGLVLPPVDGAVDYQLGGAYAPPAGVAIVSRDRTAAIASGLYNVCYINGFQIQPDEESFFMTMHPALILRDASDQPVIDVEWNEMLIDVSSAEKRSELATLVGDWIAGCKQAGFDAIEIDNLDSFTRSQGLLTENDAVAAISGMAEAAHASAMPIAQKNSAELVGRKAELGTDFVVAEECNAFDECQTYRDAYGDHVIVIEYTRAAFDAGCAAFPSLSIVLRDLDLVPAGTAGYVFDGC
jgi:hypothetical protein